MNEKSNQNKIAKQFVFVPIIQDSIVKKLNINNRVLVLKREISLKEFTDSLMPLLNKLEEFIDLDLFTIESNQNIQIVRRDWNKNSFESFWNSISYKQKEIIKISYSKDKILRKDLVQILVKKEILGNQDGVNKRLAGIVAGMTRKWNLMKLKPIFLIYGDHYVFNSEIRNYFKNFLESELE